MLSTMAARIAALIFGSSPGLANWAAEARGNESTANRTTSAMEADVLMIRADDARGARRGNEDFHGMLLDLLFTVM